MYLPTDNDTITVGALAVRFLIEAADSNGAASVFECSVPANARMPAPTRSLLESPERTQVKHELALALTDLGGATFALTYHGALNDERLAPRVERIHDLFTQLDALGQPTCTTSTPTNP